MPTKGQIDFGNEIIQEARLAVKEVGWEQTAFAAMFAHMNAAATFSRHIPQGGVPGCKIATTDKFHEDFQDMVGSLALLSAVLAEKVGEDLTVSSVVN